MKEVVSCEVRSDRPAAEAMPLLDDCAANAAVTFAILLVSGYWIGEEVSPCSVTMFVAVKIYERRECL